MLGVCLMGSGCATYFSQRPPILEDKLGIAGQEMIGTLATSSDYRVIYVRLDDSAKLCAESSPDTAQQISSAVAAAARGKVLGSDASAAEFGKNFALVAKQIFVRSQGVQLYRDGAFALCNMHVNGQITGDEYVGEMRDLRLTAQQLIQAEIDKGLSYSYDDPTWPKPVNPQLDPAKATDAKVPDTNAADGKAGAPQPSDPKVPDPKGSAQKN